MATVLGDVAGVLRISRGVYTRAKSTTPQSLATEMVEDGISRQAAV